MSYESKFFRQFCLGELKKLRFVWELENWKYLRLILEAGSILKLSERNICVNSDEIIIEVPDFDGALELTRFLPKSELHRTKIFQLTKIEGFGKNAILKKFEDGSKQLMNVEPNVYEEAFNKFVC